MADWNFACPEWERKLERGETPIPELPLFHERAKRAVDVFNNLRLPDVVGTPRLGDACGDWFRDIVAALFGSLDDHGVRHVGEIGCLVPKKQSKTTYSGALMVTALLLNQRPRAGYLLTGPTQEISDTAYNQATGIIRADPEGYLQRRFHIKDHRKTILDRTNGAMLAVKTFGMDILTGKLWVGVLVDEPHLLGKVSYAANVILQIRGGLATALDSFLMFITTQSPEPPAGVFKTELNQWRGIRDGRIKGPHVRTLPVLYEFSEALQRGKERAWADPENWPMVMPNLGRSIMLPRLIGEFENAKGKGEEEVRRWASQHLNVEIGLALHTDRWTGADHWEAASEPGLTLEKLLERSEVAVVGIDGGGLDDLLGVCVIGREKKTKRWLCWFKAFAYASVLEERKDIAPRLKDFAGQGDLVIFGAVDETDAPAAETTRGLRRAVSASADVDPLGDAAAAADHEPVQFDEDILAVVEIVDKVKEANLFPDKGAVGLDEECIADFVDALAELELTIGAGNQVVGIKQGYRLNGAIKGMARKLANGSLVQDGSELMKWCVGNAKMEQRGNAVIITKQTSGSAKIDPLAAGFNAFTLMSLNPEPAGAGSYLDEEDLILV